MFKRQQNYSILANTHISWKKALKRDWELYLLLSVPLLLTIIFKYGAYPGLRIAFMNYLPAKGYEGSEWVGFATFRKVFKDRDFIIALRNSLIFNFLEVIVSFPMPIILALMLNELRFARFKKVSQTILYLPHFLSWAIIAGIAYTLFRTETGLINNFLVNVGLREEGIPFLTKNLHWAATYLSIGVWAGMGWGSIIYLAAITSINEELYEAAMIDGAGRWRRMWHITLPGIKPTIITLLIMTLGRLMGSNYERLSSMGNVNVKAVQYQLAIYIYEKGLASGSGFSKAAAVGLFQSFVGLLLVLASDRFAKVLGEDGLI
ncbi:MAG: sugar ABC transporter permease [Clostridiales bacterium]|nr:sugar ABC transporter permease [Clostridiales bacterium]